MDEIKVVTLDMFDDDVDAIVVTLITYFDEIADMLEDEVKCPIVSIEDVVFEVK